MNRRFVGNAGSWSHWLGLALLLAGCGAAAEDTSSLRSSDDDPTPENGATEDGDERHRDPDTGDDDLDSGDPDPDNDDPPEPVECAGNILEKDLGPNDNWIGGLPDSDIDDPCGIQGPIYAYGDTESATALGLSPSCTIPADEDATISCASGRCCISGTTVQDREYAAWGCGIGFGLRHTATEERLPYSEPSVAGFRFTVEGTLTEGQYVRVHLKQPGSGENSCAPFLGGESWSGSPIDPIALVEGPFQGEVRFDEVACPADTGADCGCTPPGPAPLDLQFQVTGGLALGPYEFCVTELSALIE
jgi:hypothetical protein